MKRIISAIVLLFAVALLVHNLGQFKKEPETQQQTQIIQQREPPDAIALNARSVSYNDLGELSWRLRADEIWFFRHPDRSQFQQPRAEVFVENNPIPWRARSEHGTLEEQGQVHLHQNVVIMTRSKEAVVQRIETEYLAIDLTQHTLRSDQPVVITGPGLRITANGLYAEMDNEKIQLTNGVRSVYEP